MKQFITITVVVVVMLFGAMVCYNNLPPNDIKNHSMVPEETGVIDKVMLYVTTSQTVADWKYSNYVVVKYAYSERLGLLMIGLPFCDWGVLSTDEEEKVDEEIT